MRCLRELNCDVYERTLCEGGCDWTASRRSCRGAQTNVGSSNPVEEDRGSKRENSNSSSGYTGRNYSRGATTIHRAPSRSRSWRPWVGALG
jgi:hypothetical protein